VILVLQARDEGAVLEMTLDFNAYAVVLLVSGVLLLLFALFLFNRVQASVQSFAWLSAFTAVWSIAYAFELASGTMEAMLFWVRIEYVGIAFVPAAWFVFVVRFVGRDEWLTLKNRLLVFGFQGLTLLSVWTNPWHHLHYQSVSVDTSGPFPLLVIERGPWYLAQMAFTYVLFATGMYILLQRFRRADVVYRRQNLAVLIGALIPWSSNLIYELGFRIHRQIDLTPYAFLVGAFVLGFALFRFQLFDVVPMARERVIEGIREGMLVLDRNQRAVDLNATMRMFLGAVGKGCIGLPVSTLFPGQEELAARVGQERPDKLELELPGEASAGARALEVSITPLHDPHQRRCGTLLTFWDITERRQAARRLEAQAEELRELSHLKTRILSIIAHDLRSPLAELTGMLEITNSGMLSEEEFRRMLPLIGRSVDDASTLLDNLLHWSKSQLEGDVMRSERFDLQEVTGQNLRFFARKAENKGVTLEDRVQAGVWVDADKNMISMVVRNLISNAVKFCKAGNRITVEVTRGPKEHVLTVSDTGVGMKEEVLQKLFGLEIVSRRGTGGEAGTGLGLKLCRDFVERHGGSIQAESRWGEGSRFRVVLPGVAGE
jgi:PAS domain S-box-containing protein